MTDAEKDSYIRKLRNQRNWALVVLVPFIWAACVGLEIAREQSADTAKLEKKVLEYREIEERGRLSETLN